MEKHIVAGKIFSDLYSDLKYEDFEAAGHRPLLMEFSDKNSAEEDVPRQKMELPDNCGYSYRRNKKISASVVLREQRVRTCHINPIHVDGADHFNNLFGAIQCRAPKLFGDGKPVRIKRLTTMHTPTGVTCTWEKVKINVGDEEEMRLMLVKINGQEGLLESGAEDYADGMMETVCETTKATLATRNVCSLVAKRMGK